ncbi:MAG: hypothetical protein AAF721_40610 [Myxococcota bacterium]
MIFAGEPTSLVDGRTVSFGADAAGNWVTLRGGDGTEQRLALARWPGGVGGMELVLSPDERYAALHVYSGQSTQGFELVRLAPELSRLGGLPDTYGHGDAPVFSPDGRWLVSLMTSECRVRGTDQHFEVLQDEHATTRVVVDWAQLPVLRLPDAVVQTFAVGVEIPLCTDIERVHEFAAYGAVGFADDGAVVLRMPWGEHLRVALPVVEGIVSTDPRAAVES